MSWEVEQIGPHTLYRGDCREVLPTLLGFDAVITDPPYGMQRFKTDTAGYLTVVGPALQAVWRRLHSPGNLFVFASTREVVNVANTIPQPLQRLLWMYKPADCTYPLGGWLLKSEAILWYAKGDRLYLREKRPYQHDVYIHTRVGKEGVEGHPTVKPLMVVKDLVERSGGMTVCDPFMGSNTTGVACVQLGRIFTGIEIERRYFDLACQRLHDAIAQPDLFVPPPAPVQQRLFAGATS